MLTLGENIRDSSCHALMASQFLPIHFAAGAAVISAKVPLCAPDQRFQKVNLPAEDLIEAPISKMSPEEDNKDRMDVLDLWTNLKKKEKNHKLLSFILSQSIWIVPELEDN